MQAFHGHAALKSELLKPLRVRWRDGELFASSMLKWMPEHHLYSVSAALIGSDDVSAFEQRTGIPIALANLCEGLASIGVIMVPDQGTRSGQKFVSDERVADFAIEWLDAIQPGSDLSSVEPHFMVQHLGSVLAPSFEFAEFIEPQVRSVAEGILDLWRRETAGEVVSSQEWRAVRVAAVAASEVASDGWGKSVADFCEAVAWPVASINAEFIQHFMVLTQQVLDFLRMPFLSEEDQTNRKMVAEGWSRIAAAEKEQALDERAMHALLDSMPDIKRAMFAGQDPIVRDRVKAANIAAFEATTPMLQQQMRRLLNLLRAA